MLVEIVQSLPLVQWQWNHIGTMNCAWLKYILNIYLISDTIEPTIERSG